ncbi:unnamed protein product [Paramecium primaurelia]|uniref:Uncharacterized protein n=1 Tax=Paramecium primaurelia TaxID=5886 RepID=A0A8S1PTC6_PARPR|nr:unnamed protein product [Paramecium primaurelia]
MIRSFHSISFQQISYTPPQNQLRRSSCHCSHCSSSNIKQITLPNQQYEIVMHRKIRLANIIIQNFQPTDKYLRSKQKYKNFRIFSHNRQQNISTDNHKSPSIDQQDQIKDHSQKKRISPIQSHYSNSKQSNFYFLNHLKTQMTRIDNNLNQLIQTSRQQITEPDEPIITSKRTKQAIIKTIKINHPYKSAYSISLNKRFGPPKKMHTNPSNLLARTQQSLSKYALNCIN